MDTNIQNKVKDLLDKFRSGAISSEEFKELSAKINQSSEADLEFLFSDEWDKFNSYEPLSQDKINSLYRKLNQAKTHNAIHEGAKILVTNSSIHSFDTIMWH